MTGALIPSGGISWGESGTGLPQFSGSPNYLLGIEAFANGGQMKWQSVGDVKVGNATQWNGKTDDYSTLNNEDTWIPVYNGSKVQHTLKEKWSSVRSLKWDAGKYNLATLSVLAYWNGSYGDSGASNFQYCDRGRFGTIVTKNTGDYAAASHTHSYLPLSGGTLTGFLNFSGNTRIGANSGVTFIEGDSRLSVVNYANNAYRPVYASAFTVNSSKLIKENIQGISEEEALKVLLLKPVTFDYKECVGGEKDKVGLIAEEVLDVLPLLVDVPEGYDEANFDEDKGINNDILSIDYSKFVPYLIKLVQVQQEQINDLRHQVDKLINLVS